MIPQGINPYYGVGVVLIGNMMLIFSLMWLMKNLRYLEDRLEVIQTIIREIDRAILAFGFGARKPDPDSIFRGTATPTRPDAILTAPLSGRPCLAYRIELGYPEGDQLISTNIHLTAEESVPFLLDGRIHIHILRGSFRFTPADIRYRREYRPDQVSPAQAAQIVPPYSLIERHGRRGRTRGRLYEWIVPIDAPCEIVGETESETLSYRGAGDVELFDARIHVGPREDDAVTLDRLRRARVTALAVIHKTHRSRRLAYWIGLAGVAYSLWVYWGFFNAIDL